MDGYLRRVSSIGLRTRLLPRLLAWAVRMLAATWRVSCADPGVLHRTLEQGPVVAAFFHEHQLPLVALHRGLGFSGMASRSADGELLAGVIAHLGYGVVRGSTSRGGVRAALSALRTTLAEGGSIALAVDGPRGPRRAVQPGAAALASWSGRPLVILSVVARPAWRASSWDRFLLPLPFARVELRYDLLEPPAAGRSARALATELLQSRMLALTAGDGTASQRGGSHT